MAQVGDMETVMVLVIIYKVKDWWNGNQPTVLETVVESSSQLAITEAGEERNGILMGWDGISV
jgi:hypothetical protein